MCICSCNRLDFKSIPLGIYKPDTGVEYIKVMPNDKVYFYLVLDNEVVRREYPCKLTYDYDLREINLSPVAIVSTDILKIGMYKFTWDGDSIIVTNRRYANMIKRFRYSDQ